MLAIGDAPLSTITKQKGEKTMENMNMQPTTTTENMNGGMNMENKYAAFKKSTVEKSLSVQVYNAIVNYYREHKPESLEVLKNTLSELCGVLSVDVPALEIFLPALVNVTFKGSQTGEGEKALHGFYKVKSPSTIKKALVCKVFACTAESMNVPAMIEKGKGGKKSDAPAWNVIYAGFTAAEKKQYQVYKCKKSIAKIEFDAAGKLDEKFTFPTFEEWRAQFAA